MGGGSRQGQSSYTALGTQNIAIPLLQNLFGQETRTDVGQGFMAGGVGNNPSSLQFANQVFGPDSFSALGGLTDAIDIGGLQGEDIGGLIDRTSGFQQELMDTGFKTDIGAATDLSRMLFEEEFIPGALEQFGSAGLDARDSDTQATLLREGSRRATELGALDIDLQEAATNRRLLGAEAAPQLLDLQNLGLATEFGQSDAGQLFNNFLQLSGINTQSQGLGQSSGNMKSGQSAFGG